MDESEYAHFENREYKGTPLSTDEAFANNVKQLYA